MDILEWWVLLPREVLKGSSVGGDGSPFDPKNGVALWCLFREKMEDLPLPDVRGALLEDMMKDRSSGDGDERDGGSSGQRVSVV